jgi:hypothetical protein
MKKIQLGILGIFLAQLVFADANIPIQIKPRGAMAYLVYCRDLPVYVTREAYQEVIRYQTANINMDLMVNGEFAQGPCVPGQSAEVNRQTFDIK